MTHTCYRCSQICSDEANDFGLTDKGEVICENCFQELKVQEWWHQQNEDEEYARSN